eukprot:scaffold2574_cov98-Cylindrotheca_fusiformis.AAC.13
MVDRGLFDKKGSLDAFFDPRLHSQIPCVSGDPRLLPSHFHPGNWDVICHSGKDVHNHGNNLQSYVKAKSRSQKSAIISEIVTSIRESSTHGGGFVRLDNNTCRWYEVGDKVARDKVGQTLRDISNAKANKKRKRERVQPNDKCLSSKIEPSFYTPRTASATKLDKGTTATDPLGFLPQSIFFEGVCRVRPHSQKQVWKESVELRKAVGAGLEQDDVEWFEADMLATWTHDFF